MASETTTAELYEEASDVLAYAGQSDCDNIPKDDMCTMEIEDAIEVDATTPVSIEEKPGSISITEVDHEDAEWAVVKQCLSVFVIEVYQCKLCASFNSTQKATVTSHLKEKHPTEWMILKDAENSSSLPGGSKTNAISRGDLEEMVEKELTDGNRKKSKERSKVSIVCVPSPITATSTGSQTSTQTFTAKVSVGSTPTVMAVSRPLPAVTAVSRPLPEVTAVSRPLPEVTAVSRPLPEVTAVSRQLPAVTAVSRPLPEVTAVSRPLPEVTAVSRPLPEDTAVSRPLPEVTAVSRPLLEVTAVSRPLPEVTAVSRPLPAVTAVSRPLPKVTAVSRPLPEVTAVSRPLPAVTAVSRPLPAAQYSVVPLVKLVLTNTLTSQSVSGIQSVYSTAKTRNRIILPAGNTKEDVGVQNQRVIVVKSSPTQQGLLRPVLRRNAKCKPREFKDFVVNVPGKRGHDETGDNLDEDDDCQDNDVDDNDADEDYVPEDGKDGERQGKENAGESVPVPVKTANRPRKFQCEKCLTRFGTVDALFRHGKLNRCVGIPITSKEFPCDKCEYKGTSVSSLKIHRHVHQQRKEKKYGCVSCKKGFTSLKSLRRHRRSRCSALKVKKPKTPKTYSCEQCEKVFRYKKALKDHMATHSELRCFKCDGCTKSFKTYGALRRHRKKHRDNFIYCDQCNFKTRWASSLKNHYQSLHLTDNREFLQCPDCSYQTQNKYYLRRHLESHLDIRPFMCEICGKNFKTQVILNIHLETHKDSEYKCDKCDYVGKTRPAVYAHQLVHLPRDRMTYKCEQCDWVGKRKSELHMHYRKHSSLKMYHCEDCGKSYKHKHALTRHTRERHLQKLEDLSTLEAEEAQSQAENAVLDTVQDMLDSAQMGLRAEETHSMNGIQTILGGPPLKSGLNMQQYQVIQVPREEVVGDVETDHMDTVVSHQPHVVIHDPRVPVAQFFEISTSDGVGDGHHLPVHTAQ